MPSPAKTTRKRTKRAFQPVADPDSGLTKKQTERLYDKLVAERERLIEGVRRHVGDAMSGDERLPDEADQASLHANQAYLLRVADKEQKLLQQVARALEKLRTGEGYGICEGNGEPIGYKRLSIRPWTRYSVEYKEQLESGRAA